jgi:hypothetical protein
MSVRRILVSGSFLDSFLRESELWTSSLPDDVHIIGVAEQRDSQTFAFLVESTAFCAVGEGKLIPFVEATFTRKRPDVKLLEPMG